MRSLRTVSKGDLLAREAMTPTPMSETSASTPIAICVVDDDPGFLQLLEILLDGEGFKSLTFESSDRFVEHARAHQVRLAILDVHMPGLTGLQVQALLKEESPQTRVIIITGHDDPAIRNQAESNGAAGFLLKPFDIGRFLALVRTTMEAI